MDTRASSRGGHFTRDALDRIPSARDPWAVIAQTPGIVMLAVNVGGNLSGTQGQFVGRATSYQQSKYTLDGVDVTDIAANGGSSVPVVGQ